MFCKYCGSEMSGGEGTCPGCGCRREALPVFAEEEMKEGEKEDDLEEEGGYIIFPRLQGENLILQWK